MAADVDRADGVTRGFLFADLRGYTEYVERNWAAERWSRGCYGGAFGPSGWTDFGPSLREPIGRIHWAGTETATVWNGYIDGAITSGRRAALEAAG